MLRSWTPTMSLMSPDHIGHINLVKLSLNRSGYGLNVANTVIVKMQENFTRCLFTYTLYYTKPSYGGSVKPQGQNNHATGQH